MNTDLLKAVLCPRCKDVEMECGISEYVKKSAYAKEKPTKAAFICRKCGLYADGFDYMQRRDEARNFFKYRFEDFQKWEEKQPMDYILDVEPPIIDGITVYTDQPDADIECCVEEWDFD